MITPARQWAVHHALTELPDLVAALQVELVQPRAAAGGDVRPPFASRPPLDVGVVSDIDEAWNGLTTWARDWCETYALHGPDPWTWTTVCAWLDAHWPNTADTHPAADDFADELVYRRRRDDNPAIRDGWLVVLRRHTDDGETRTWRPLPGRWTCPVMPDAGPSRGLGGPNPPNLGSSYTDVVPEPQAACGALLLEHTAERLIRCPHCGATWAGDDAYERLGRLLGCEMVVTIDQAAVLAKVHRATIYRWIEGGQLPRTPDGLIDKRDLALLAVRRVAP